MADTQYDAFGAHSAAYHGRGHEHGHGQTQEQAEPPLSLVSKSLSFVGAASSIALVIGLGMWGYQLTVRDVTDVPVIRALEGPARVQPTDPGGQLAQHQGLAVNNVQSEGHAEGPTPQVILAPEPIDLTTDDVILAAPAEAEVVADDVAEAVGTVVSLSLEEQNLTVEQQAELLASRLAEGVEPLAPVDGEIGEVKVTLARAEIPALDPSIPGVKRSLRPAQRPKVDLASLQQEAAIAAAVGSVLASAEVKPEAVAAGTRLVQLGAYDERELAEAEWDKIATKFDDYIDGKKRLIQEAKSGGRTFYRLRAVGFEDLNASRRFCAVLVAANAACIPVLAR